MIADENIVLSESPSDQVSTPQPARLTDVQVSDQNVALNLMVSFLALAQKRGTFALEESAKIWECVKMFEIPPPPPSQE